MTKKSKDELLLEGFKGNDKRRLWQSIQEQAIKEGKSKTSVEIYKTHLSRIGNMEQEYGCTIFELDETESKLVIAKAASGSMAGQIKYIIPKYLDFCKQQYGIEPKVDIMNLINDNNIAKLSSELKVSTCFKTYDELIHKVTRLNAPNFKILIVIFRYMGLSDDEIMNLTTSDINFTNATIKCYGKLYYDIDDVILRNIRQCINDLNNPFEFVIKPPRADRKKFSIANIFNDFDKKARPKGYTFTMKDVQQSGRFHYYKLYHEEILKDEVDNTYKFLRAFGIIINPPITPGRWSTCRKQFLLDYDAFKDRLGYINKLFKVDISVTNEELESIHKDRSYYKRKSSEVVSNVEYDNFHIEHKSYPEEFAEEPLKRGAWARRNEQTGKENEELVLEKFKSLPNCIYAKYMEDYSGYDIQANISEKKYRIEVKTIKANLEFEISENELRSISKRHNSIIALVYFGGVKILDNFEDRLGINIEYLIKDNINCYSAVCCSSLKVKLRKELYSELKEFNDYFTNN